MRKTLLCLGAALLAPLAGCGKAPEAPEKPRPALTMIATPTATLDMALTGTVQPQVQTQMGFRVLGRIIARPVNAGDRIEAGQTLAAIDPLALELAARAATAALASARAQYDNAVTTEARQKELLARKTASQATFDAAEEARSSAQATVAQAQANLVKAQEQLGYAVLKADYAGVVTATNAEVGQTVSAGQAVVTVAEPTRRDAVVDAPIALADALHRGARFNVFLQLDPSLRASGMVREVAPDADPATRSRRIKIDLDNPPEAFRLGATVTARLAAAVDEAIRLPASALLERDGRKMVFVVDPQKSTVALRDIVLGPDSDETLVVESGLKSGERVVVAGVHRLQEGQAVRINGGEAP